MPAECKEAAPSDEICEIGFGAPITTLGIPELIINCVIGGVADLEIDMFKYVKNKC